MTEEEEKWDLQYQNKNTKWDIGYASTPLTKYFDQLKDKFIRILIPGCGFAHEAAYLYKKGFKNITIVDIAATPLKQFAEKYPDFPEKKLIQADFFSLEGRFDLIVEQTFFCSLPPTMRQDYVKKMAELLTSEGKLVGVLWSIHFNEDNPPYGGSKEEYLAYFKPFFHLNTFENSYNSILPRDGKELFLNATKRDVCLIPF